MMEGFKKGELILSSTPYVYVLSNTERGKRCDFCFSSNSALKRCSQCLFAYFCNKTCQCKAWDFHKDECRYIKKVHPKEPIPSLRLISQLIYRIKRNGRNERVDGSNRVFADLESHVAEIKKDPRTCQQIFAFIGTLRDYISLDNIPDPVQFMEIFGKMVINTFSIWDPEMQSIGSGLYLSASVFDHSCEPNAEVVFEGTTLMVRAVCDIPGRDLKNVYISYIDQMQFSKDRQQQLESQYYFKCQCTRCLNLELDKLMSKLRSDKKDGKEVEVRALRKLEKLKAMKKNKEQPSVIWENAMDELASVDGVLSNRHLFRLKLIEYVFDACLQMGRWTEALAMGRELVKPYKMFYGCYHPNYCILLLKIIKIMVLLNQGKRATEMVDEAEDAIRVSHGVNHPLYIELLKQKACCLIE